ncbi:alpha/beta fold hydrolase [Marinifilum caeruleilacunae]|uniref:Alpha/beta hydrolase n=1 Tax=Marinifilum caeruleilacunae TaxID=2499076 RepID=A0ABX1WU96_9BACT|nr:alpha/beta hydrolase [Marinifilum caeruleilacunae]NOU59642.1 alpha/beta hydrolase [Marinifilum caeruleilacunae]
MKKTLVVFVFALFTIVVNSQTIYSKAYGNPSDKPLIFLHGGPGYNCVNFEATTAQQLADNGFYVIVYDRRGEGRSKDLNTKFTFEETFEDLNAVYQKYGISKSSLIGHSFGGIVATLFAEKYPDKIQSIILVGAPISLQETFKTIISTSKDIYKSKNDSINLNYISIIEKMDTSSIQYSSNSFMHAMQNGFYYPKEPTIEALNIYKKFKTDSLLIKYSSKMTYEAPKGFWQNEKYTTLDLKDNLKQIVKNGTPVFGLYGKDDGLFSESQVKTIVNLVGKTNLIYLNNCSHNLFIDQQTKFINALKKWIE